MVLIVVNCLLSPRYPEIDKSGVFAIYNYYYYYWGIDKTRVMLLSSLVMKMNRATASFAIFIDSLVLSLCGLSLSQYFTSSLPRDFVKGWEQP